MNSRQKELEQLFLNEEKQTLEQLKKNYQAALDDINERIAILKGREDASLQNVVYQINYQQALRGQIQTILEQLQDSNFETVSEYLAKAYEEGFIGTLYDLQGQGIPLIMPIDQKQVVAAIKHETKLSEDLYTALGKDTKELSKQIASEITRGISTASGYADIARSIASTARISQNNAMRIARTEAHRIQNKAISDAQWGAREKGADIVKIWSAALDGRTRDTHRRLDGQIRELDEPFEIDGMTAMEPGDFGDPSEDCNCRCRSNSKARWLLDAESTKHLGNTDDMSDEELEPIAKKLGIDVDELRKYSDQIIPVQAKDYEDFRRQYERLVNHDAVGRVRLGEQKISERRKTTEGVFDTFNNSNMDSVRPHNVMKDMKKSDIGKETLEYLEKEQVPVRLCYGIDNPDNVSGIYDSLDDEIIVFCDKTKSVKETAKTVIHEAHHRKLGSTHTKAEEVECYKVEVIHEKGELTESDIDAIIKYVSENYPDLK